MRGRMSQASIGFGASVRDGSKDASSDLLQIAEPRDLLNFGLIPEFVSRFPMLVSTHALGETELVDVLTTPKHALIKQYVKLYGMSGTHFHITDNALREVARRAIERKTGARGLRAILDRILLESMFDVPEDESLHSVVVHEAAVRGEEDPLVLGENQDLKTVLSELGEDGDEQSYESNMSSAAM